MSDSCPLCKKVQNPGELPDDELVWQFPCSIAVLGPWQYYLGYCVLISRWHSEELLDLPEELTGKFYVEMLQLAKAIRSVVRPKKLNFELLGNQVPHPHWHIFPRFESDKHHRQPVWVDLAIAEHDPELRGYFERGTQSRAETVRQLQAELRRLARGPS
jgi:diadenosine tetraphosphate (Ap4A) HIT family hydrolase